MIQIHTVMIPGHDDNDLQADVVKLSDVLALLAPVPKPDDERVIEFSSSAVNKHLASLRAELGAE